MIHLETTTDARMTRRTILGGVLALTAIAAAGPAAAQQGMQTFIPSGVTPKPKGPRVFLDYDKEEID